LSQGFVGNQPLPQRTDFITNNSMDLLNIEQTYDLTEQIFQAYYDCRKNKRNTINALKFEKHFE
jgi:hypothetical protein